MSTSETFKSPVYANLITRPVRSPAAPPLCLPPSGACDCGLVSAAAHRCWSTFVINPMKKGSCIHSAGGRFCGQPPSTPHPRAHNSENFFLPTKKQAENPICIPNKKIGISGHFDETNQSQQGFYPFRNCHQQRFLPPCITNRF